LKTKWLYCGAPATKTFVERRWMSAAPAAKRCRKDDDRRAPKLTQRE
jgi:hypothetical protein